jgi:Tfp pilus assembly protein PilO
MSQEQPMQSPALAARRPQLKLARIRQTPGLSMIGLPELFGLTGAAVLALITVFAYFYFYLPAQSRLTNAQQERDRLQAALRSSQVGFETDKSVTEKVNEITASMKDFEGNYLSASATGRMSLYTTLNDLIKSNGLKNTAGPSYAPLEPIGTKSQVQATVTAEKQSHAKWQTIYPGIEVSVTVEGPYQRVRHFVRDIESSRQFLIINEVELEGVTQSGATAEVAPPVTAGRPSVGVVTPGGKGALVSLRLEMATYFRRPEADNAQ